MDIPERWEPAGTSEKNTFKVKENIIPHNPKRLLAPAVTLTQISVIDFDGLSWVCFHDFLIPSGKLT